MKRRAGEVYIIMYKADEVAAYIINYCNEKKYDITNLRLQKEMYFIQGYFCRSMKKLCFTEEFECWEYGPVIPKIYIEYSIYGSHSIPPVEFKCEYFWDDVRNELNAKKTKMDLTFLEADKKAIEGMIDSCAEYAPFELVNMSHSKGPWKTKYDPNNKHVKITNEEMMDFFGSIE